MTASLDSLGIGALSNDEKIALIGEIWDSMAADPAGFPLTEAQKRELDRRVAQYDANPGSGAAWDQVKAEALARWAK